MRAIKKQPDVLQTLYFDFTKRLSPGEILSSCDASPTVILTTISDPLVFSALAINTSGPLIPPPPATQIAQNLGVSCTVSGGQLPADLTALTAMLPDGTIGTIYTFKFMVTTSLGNQITEGYQVWVSANDYPIYWTSHWELNRRYSATAITQWADADNTRDATQIQSNVWAAVSEATDDFQQQLRGSPAGLITPDLALRSSGLRRNCTMLAAAILYRARGTRDTSDEEGRDRFSSEMKRVDKFIKQIRAGQRRLVDGDVGVTTHPVVVVTAQPYLSQLGPRLTPPQMLNTNICSELAGVPSYYSWSNPFDASVWGISG